MTASELTLSKALRDAGIEQTKAEAIAETIFGAIRDNVATKGDLTALGNELRGEIRLSQSELRREIQSLKIWGGGVAVASVAFLLTALHYWPPK